MAIIENGSEIGTNKAEEQRTDELACCTLKLLVTIGINLNSGLIDIKSIIDTSLGNTNTNIKKLRHKDINSMESQVT